MTWNSQESCKNNVKNFFFLDFPGGTVDKNLPAKEGDTGLIPGPGRLHMLQGNSSMRCNPMHHDWAHVLRPLKPVPQPEKPLQWEAHAPQQERSPHLLQLEKALKEKAAMKTQPNKNNKINNNLKFLNHLRVLMWSLNTPQNKATPVPKHNTSLQIRSLTLGCEHI